MKAQKVVLPTVQMHESKGGGLSTDILKESAARGDREGFFITVIFGSMVWKTKLTYANELYQFYLELKNRKRQIVVVNGSIPNPTTDEINEDAGLIIQGARADDG